MRAGGMFSAVKMVDHSTRPPPTTPHQVFLVHRDHNFYAKDTEATPVLGDNPVILNFVLKKNNKRILRHLATECLSKKFVVVLFQTPTFVDANLIPFLHFDTSFFTAYLISVEPSCRQVMCSTASCIGIWATPILSRLFLSARRATLYFLTLTCISNFLHR